MTERDYLADRFEEHRTHLRSVAYRMLGSSGEVPDTASWTVPPLFEALRRIGNIPVDDYRRTFNLGVGMIFCVPQRAAARAEAVLARLGESPFRIGEVVPARRGRARVEYR